jgi:Fic family protein
MNKLSLRRQKIISIVIEKGLVSSSGVYSEMIKAGESASLVTVKRALSKMVGDGFLTTSGAGRSTNYKITVAGRVLSEIDAKKYCSVEPDKRYGLNRYNFDLFADCPLDIFSESESRILNKATAEYRKRIKDLPPTIQKKELERLIIELSWKSSKIEGNTYTLLDTEKLILENKVASGRDKKETQMILNHKDAFNFVRENAAQFKTVSKANLEALHAILVKNLAVGLGFRKKVVGVIGSAYRPLDNIYQITEAVEGLGKTVSKISNPYAKALIALLGVSYIQPFEDGNKRAARLMANAVLLAHNLAPLSYRSVDESDYREAIIVFYELNSIAPFKKIFIEQCDFAAQNYAVK